MNKGQRRRTSRTWYSPLSIQLGSRLRLQLIFIWREGCGKFSKQIIALKDSRSGRLSGGGSRGSRKRIEGQIC